MSILNLKVVENSIPPGSMFSIILIFKYKLFFSTFVKELVDFLAAF